MNICAIVIWRVWNVLILLVPTSAKWVQYRENGVHHKGCAHIFGYLTALLHPCVFHINVRLIDCVIAGVEVDKRIGVSTGHVLYPLGSVRVAYFAYVPYKWC